MLPKKGLTAKQVERMQKFHNSDLPEVSTQPRSKNESKDEKRARKQAVKEERKVKYSSQTWDLQRVAGREVPGVFSSEISLHQVEDLNNVNIFLCRNGEQRRKLTS